jgi:aspartyl-tRNA(Asn)/glutamyl-tRNA(Gln) amidotransferase subunit C
MDVHHIAKLANLTLTSEEEKKLSQEFAETLTTVELINELDTSQVAPTSQVTGLSNVVREDVIDPSRVLSQHQCLSQASQVHEGYFVVPAVIN